MFAQGDLFSYWACPAEVHRTPQALFGGILNGCAGQLKALRTAQSLVLQATAFLGIFHASLLRFGYCKGFYGQRPEV